MDPDSPDDTERAPRLSTRPLRADAARNKAKVLAAAQAAFAVEGLAVPLDEIARRAGVGAGTVYRHFPTKEALFEAVILDRLTRMATYARSLIASAEPGDAFFEYLHRMIIGASGSKDIADALAGADLATAGMITATKLDIRESGATLLDQAQRAGAVRTDVGLVEVMTLLSGASLAMQQHPADPALAETLFAVLRDGLRARPPGQ